MFDFKKGLIHHKFGKICIHSAVLFYQLIEGYGAFYGGVKLSVEVMEAPTTHICKTTTFLLNYFSKLHSRAQLGDN